jgi:uncharacterized phiE125 gp8 family phage protein
MGLKSISGPEVEPFTIEECRTHLEVQPYEVDSDGVETHPHDAMIMAMQAQAREFCEEFTGLSFARKTYELALDAFPAEEIEVPPTGSREPATPLVEVLSVKYVDADEVEQTIDPSAYTIDNYQKPAWLFPASSSTWPATGALVNAVKIRFVAGYGPVDTDYPEAETLPYLAGAGVKRMLAYLYANRGDSDEKSADTPERIQQMLRPLRIRLGMA